MVLILIYTSELNVGLPSQYKCTPYAGNGPSSNVYVHTDTHGITIVAEIRFHTTLQLFPLRANGVLESGPTYIGIAIRYVAYLYWEEPDTGWEVFGCL